MNTSASIRRPVVPFAVIALVVYWCGVAILMHLLEPEFNPFDAPLSAYVLGGYGAWMTTTYFAAAGMLLLLAFGFRRNMPPSLWTRAGIVLFCISGLADLVMGFFAMQYPMTPPLTLHGAVHAVASLVGAASMILGCVSFSWSFRALARWQPISTSSLVLALLMLGVFVVGLLSFGGSGGGFRQRLYVGLMLLWVIVVAWHWIRWLSDPMADAIDS
jgi:hypothetical protein